jgi:hypothetical protein
MPEKEFEYLINLKNENLSALFFRALNDPHIRDCLQSFNGEHFFLRRK